MSYAGVVTTKNLLGGKWLIRITETGGTSAGAKVIDLANPNGDGLQPAIPFSKFELVQVEAAWLTGDGGTITPKLQRLDPIDGTSYRTIFQAGEACIENLWTFDPRPEVRTTHLKHMSQPASGTNNTAWVEYVVRKLE